MRSKATRGMFTADGAGQEFLTAETEDAIVERLEERGIVRGEVSDHEYDMAFEAELSALIEEAEDDYGEMMADRYEDAREDREYWANRPGGEADYMYG